MGSNRVMGSSGADGRNRTLGHCNKVVTNGHHLASALLAGTADCACALGEQRDSHSPAAPVLRKAPGPLEPPIRACFYETIQNSVPPQLNHAPNSTHRNKTRWQRLVLSSPVLTVEGPLLDDRVRPYGLVYSGPPSAAVESVTRRLKPANRIQPLLNLIGSCLCLVRSTRI